MRLAIRRCTWYLQTSHSAAGWHCQCDHVCVLHAVCVFYRPGASPSCCWHMYASKAVDVLSWAAVAFQCKATNHSGTPPLLSKSDSFMFPSYQHDHYKSPPAGPECWVNTPTGYKHQGDVLTAWLVYAECVALSCLWCGVVSLQTATAVLSTPKVLCRAHSKAFQGFQGPQDSVLGDQREPGLPDVCVHQGNHLHVAFCTSTEQRMLCCETTACVQLGV